jgi:hypothetical protein
VRAAALNDQDDYDDGGTDSKKINKLKNAAKGPPPWEGKKL